MVGKKLMWFQQDSSFLVPLKYSSNIKTWMNDLHVPLHVCMDIKALTTLAEMLMCVSKHAYSLYSHTHTNPVGQFSRIWASWNSCKMIKPRVSWFFESLTGDPGSPIKNSFSNKSALTSHIKLHVLLYIPRSTERNSRYGQFTEHEFMEPCTFFMLLFNKIKNKTMSVNFIIIILLLYF